ncbi:hypothetical protein Nepgr_003457 [Nepenthes gracilis]|uniref:RING-type E3 ubiquitin transferase n=1 Tax=Nepenthes gracilis TaxID=150966 RepID=A0AAD3XDM4_NEPGR|nr:hypothetical protein Nepgr_003457 [Nepenthes gracilis]
MIRTTDRSGRRILTFPAVHPSDAITPTTLLNTQISLAKEICKYKSKISAANQKNARNAIRLVEVVLLFLEKLRYCQSDLSSSIILSLSELHFIFQKLRFLLEDCTRTDARLWMLMNARSVATYFRLLIRDVAVALDVIPLDLYLSDEAKDLVGFVIGQARKARFEVSLEDDGALNLVVLILDRFEKKVIPDPSDLRRVLEYLGIRRWSECTKEVRFLDEEISFDKTSDNEAALLSNLRGLMIYCRCVLFDAVDNEIDRNIDNRSNCLISSRLNLEDFRCPISLEIMADPVTISTGHTYDRASILKWFREGNPICPNTGEMLETFELLPNLALQRLIRQFCAETGVAIPKLSTRADRDTARTDLVDSPAAKEALKMAADFLTIKLATGVIDERNKAAYEIRLLTKRNIFNRACLVESGSIPYLLNLTSSKDSVLQENAIAAVLNLSKNSEAKAIIVENGGLPMILNVLKGGVTMAVRQHSAAVLFYLSSVDEYRGLIGKTQGAIQALVELIQVGNDSGKKNALVAIIGLLVHPSNHDAVLDTELVLLLVNLVRSSEREGLLIYSFAVLSALAETHVGSMAILRVGALHTVVEFFCSPSMPVKEHCVSLLLALCINGGREVVEVLAKNPALIASLYSILTDGTSRASKKASSLISIFHDFSQKSSSSSIHRPLPREHFIPVW